MGSSIVDLAILAGIVGGGYWLISSGYLQNLIGVYNPNSNLMQYPSEAEEGEGGDDEEDGDEDEDEGKGGGGKKKRGGKKRDNEQQSQSPFIPGGGQGYPQQQQQQYPYQQQPQYSYQQSAPPPGAVSSLYPVNVPSGPPYVSQTVGTYSQYSPYNQFNVYKEYQTPAAGQFRPNYDDNVGFTDIKTDSYQCRQCKSICQRRLGSYQCMACRPSCKQVYHYFSPPQTGWGIGPVGQLPAGQMVPSYQSGPQYSPYSSYLGAISGLLQGEDVFADMDDYHRGRRFDCHNKLKRRVRGRDNTFVEDKDYWADNERYKVTNL